MSTAIVKLGFLPLEGEELNKFMPEFVADKRLKDPEKIREDLINKKHKWIEDAGNHTFTSRLNTIGGYVYKSTIKEGLIITDNLPDKNYFTFFNYSNNKEEKVYEFLLEKIQEYNIDKLIWHNVDRYNLSLHLLSIKYQLRKINFFEEVLSSENKLTENLSKNITIEHLQKYFNISIEKDQEEFFKEIDLVSGIYELTV